MEKLKPLYRKNNWRARGAHHPRGGDARHSRGTKNGVSEKMSSKNHGFDYTPLFRFLFSRIGKEWSVTHSEAVSRLNDTEPISWMVVKEGSIQYDLGYFRTENSKYNTLFVDSNGILQKAKPELKNEDFFPSCGCCTHTFNGNPLNNKYRNPV
jgi:hypothetical protein